MNLAFGHDHFIFLRPYSLHSMLTKFPVLVIFDLHLATLLQKHLFWKKETNNFESSNQVPYSLVLPYLTCINFLTPVSPCTQIISFSSFTIMSTAWLWSLNLPSIRAITCNAYLVPLFLKKKKRKALNEPSLESLSILIWLSALAPSSDFVVMNCRLLGINGW